MEDPINGNIRVLLLNPQTLLRASLAQYLSSGPGFEVAGECGSSAEALAVLNNSAAVSIDVVLLDFDFETEQAADFIPAARRAGYEGRFLIVSTAASARNSAWVFRLGVSGVFFKSEPPDQLVRAIRTVARGDIWMDSKLVHLMADDLIERLPNSDDISSGQKLGKREQKVLLGILRGFSNRAIGTNLGISESAVKNIIQNLFSRTGVRKRTQLVRLALEGSFGDLGEGNPSREKLLAAG